MDSSVSQPLSNSPSKPTLQFKMKYRYLGNTGLLVSSISFGCMTFDDVTSDLDTAYAIMVEAYKSGVYFFDNAEFYHARLSEIITGQAIQRDIDDGAWAREDLAVTTKIFFGPRAQTVPNCQGLSRKHIVEGLKASLKRISQDYVDVVFCHRADPNTPIEETVRAMAYVIQQGWAFYWGSSSWTAYEIAQDSEIADVWG